MSVFSKTRLRFWYLLFPPAAAIIFLSKMQVVMMTGTVIVCLAAIFVAASTLHGRVDAFVLTWVVVFPLGYYFLTFPRERSLFTLDRALIGLLVAAVAFGGQPLRTSLPAALKSTGIAWGGFLLTTLIGLRLTANPLGNIKQLMDVYVLPGILAWYIVRAFPVRHHLLALHSLTCVMSIYVAGIGFVELLTGQDLLAFPTGIFLVEETGFTRVNGPFLTNNSFGLIGLISFCFLLFMRRVIGERMPQWQRVLHAAGITSALGIAVMPMFRSMLITLALIVLVELYSNKKMGVRAAVVVLILLAGVGFFAFKTLAPEVFDYRVSDPSDVYARVAQQRQTFQLFASHPIAGVGWGNYMAAAYNVSDTSYNGVDSVGSAHNTLGAILAETGLLGTLPFVASQWLLFRAFWRLRRRGTRDATLASICLLYIFASYWITGVNLTSGYYSDLNMWYFFVAAVIYKFAITEPFETGILHRHQAESLSLIAGRQRVQV
jgi:O-antigen ligase